MSAAIPRIYRLNFQRDIYKDLRILEKSIGKGDEEGSNLDLFSLEMFENIAYAMAKHADPKIPNEEDEWLDGFSRFSVYQVLPQLIELWGLNVKADVEAKKLHPTEREMTTPLFLLRYIQLWFSIADLDLLSIGLINDMYADSRNDSCSCVVLGTQEDMDRF